MVNCFIENHLQILQRIYFCLRASTLIFKNQEKKSKLVSNNAASKSNKLKIKL